MKNTPKDSSLNNTKDTATANRLKGKAKNKKAQDAGAAAALVAVLALLIIFYLLFIPPSYRDQILEGNGTTSTTGETSEGAAVKEQLLKASPGTLSPIDAEEIEHNIPAITLYAKTNSEVLHSTGNIYVKGTIFGQKTASVNFQVEDPENTDNVLLTFKRPEGKGNMLILLNENEVFSGEIKKENPEPVRLPQNYLNRGANNLEFIAEKPGFAFWRKNRQQLESIQVTADVKDVTKRESENVFVVSSTEKSNVKRTILRFTPECTIGRVGKLNVLINSHSVYYSVPDCGGRAAIEFAPEVLREGENAIRFESEQGSYLIDLIRITSELKEVIQPAYYFEVEEEDLESIRDGATDIVLRINFVEGGEQKSAKINVNGREFNLYQEERVFEKNLNDYVIEGNNAVKILPDTTLEIINMEVVTQ